MKKHSALQQSKGVPVTRIGVMAAFGCNYQGDISPAQVIRTLEDGMAIAAETGAGITLFSLADTMGWATPARIERVIGEVRGRWPDMTLVVASARYAGSCGGECACGAETGGDALTIPPSAVWVGVRSPGSRRRRAISAPRNWCCCARKWGSDTGVDLDALIEVGRLAEEIVGHQLPSELIHAGSLDAFRRKAA